MSYPKLSGCTKLFVVRAPAAARRAVQVKKKMSAEDFLKNNRGINDGADLAPEFMRSLYERIVCNEIQVHRNTSRPL